MNNEEIIKKLKAELLAMTMRAINAEIERDLNDRVYQYAREEISKLRKEIKELKGAENDISAESAN